MFKVNITNTTQNNKVLAYSHNGRQMLRIEIPAFALNHEVIFNDEECFRSFCNQYKDKFESEELIHTHKFTESQAQKVNEKNELAEFKENMQIQMDEIKQALSKIAGDVKLTIEDKSSGEEVASAEVQGGKDKKDGKGK